MDGPTGRSYARPMDKDPGAPAEPVAASPRMRWRNIFLFTFLCILVVVLMSYGFAYMSGGKRGVWGASHYPGAHSDNQGGNSAEKP